MIDAKKEFSTHNDIFVYFSHFKKYINYKILFKDIKLRSNKQIGIFFQINNQRIDPTLVRLLVKTSLGNAAQLFLRSLLRFLSQFLQRDIARDITAVQRL